ncbi:hypothetical protein B0H10DRAFT_1959060 [Mycena sp. CBHHK59/15]|nr:hypothetical protein B0H10DRAFT_1959060 [Mycena sp. CBHHK59/15]
MPDTNPYSLPCLLAVLVFLLWRDCAGLRQYSVAPAYPSDVYSAGPPMSTPTETQTVGYQGSVPLLLFVSIALYIFTYEWMSGKTELIAVILPTSFLCSRFFVAYPVLFHLHPERHLYCQWVDTIQLFLVFGNLLNLWPSQIYPKHAAIPTITLETTELHVMPGRWGFARMSPRKDASIKGARKHIRYLTLFISLVDIPSGSADGPRQTSVLVGRGLPMPGGNTVYVFWKYDGGLLVVPAGEKRIRTCLTDRTGVFDT